MEPPSDRRSASEATGPGEMRIQRLFIYPIKSILPVEVTMAEITSEGFRFDRQYLVVKAPQNDSQRLVEHLTIKTTHRLALFQPFINDDWSELTVRCTDSDAPRTEATNVITLPLSPSPLASVQARVFDVNIFGTTAVGLDMGEGPAAFFSRHLGIPTRLLFISGKGRREIPGIAYIPRQLASLTVNTDTGGDLQPQRIRFADAAPFLVTSTASENQARLRLPASSRSDDVIVRFRPNIHVDVGPNGRAFEEDHWRELVVSTPQSEKGDHKAIIRCVFGTPRCVSLNVDLVTGMRASKENQLYGLLARDRRVNKAFPHKPVFGQYAFAAPNGATIRVGDIVRVTETARPEQK